MENNQQKKDVLHCKVSIESTSSANSDTSLISEVDKLPSWRQNLEARGFCIKTLTSMYALLLSMISLVIEVSPTWAGPNMWVGYTLFSIWMYGSAILFFVYLYFFVINPRIVNWIMKWTNIKFLKKPNNYYIEDPVFNGEGAGTLYLRLGALFFGSVGSIIWGTEIVLCFFNVRQSFLYVIKFILALLFTFIQMIFIFCYSKITIKRSNIIARFGLMHCVAVNLWTWFSLCMAKGTIKKMKKEQKYAHDASSSSESEEIVGESEVENSTLKSVFSFETHGKQLRTLAQMGSGSNIMLTSLVEFSLIGAAICFIIWKSRDDDDNVEKKKDVRKRYFKFDCRSTSVGIFLGIILHIGSVVTMALHDMFTKAHYDFAADSVVGYAEIIMFSIGILACGFAIFRMRNLQYRLHAHSEVIDEILLIVGLAGEMVYSSVGLDIFLGQKVSHGNASTVVFSAFILRIVQVILQTLFILISSKLRSLSHYNMEHQPGKQVVTFLFVCNINLFIYHSFETMESSFGFPAEMPVNYNSIMTICTPIVVFYRFHSSACLAEIWKHAYNEKDHHHALIHVEKSH